MLRIGKKMKMVTIVLLVTFTFLSLRIDLWAEVVKDSGHGTGVSCQSVSGASESPTSAKQFQDKLVEIQGLISELEIDLEAGRDVDAKRNYLKERNIDLQNIANDLRQEFSETRSGLVSKGLPGEIIQRHDEFVGKFEERLRTTLDNLNEIEKSQKGEERDKVKKAKEHLKSNLPKPRCIPTTNPTHILKPLKQAPRQDARKSSQGFFAKISDFFCSEVEAAEDCLGETIEVQLTQEIKDLAASLDNQPLKIYEYVRNNFEYEPYYGSLKGTTGCLHDKAGNDYDQASLLIALLRAANIQSRYVVGQIEVPIERAKSWLGIDNSWRVADVMVTYGNPASVIVKGGQPSAIRMEHCWVEAYVDYIPSRGAVHKQPDTWISLDPSFKEGVIYEPEDISTAVSFDVNGYLNHQQTGDALDYYMDQLETYLSQAMPDKILSQMGRIGVIKIREIPYLQSALPNKMVSMSGRYAEISDSVRYKVVVTLRGDGVLTEDMVYQANLPAIGGKRLTLSYTGDQSPYNNPAYTVVLQPEIKLDGVTQVIGGSIGAGLEQQVVIDLIMPNQEIERIENTVTVGGFYTLVCTWPSSNGEDMISMSQRLNTNITNLGDAFLDTSGFLKEDLTGDFLYLRGKSWFTQVGLVKELASSFMHLPIFQDIGYASVSVQVDVDYLFGLPYTMSLSGLMIDADRNISTVIPNTGEEWKTKEFITLTGYAASALEHLIWEQKYGIGGISAVKAIQIANEQGITVYDIDSTNVRLIDTLAISEDVKTNMRDAINAGNVVKTPSGNITHSGWTGVGYIVQDPTTGEGRYEIGMGSGGEMTRFPPSVSRGKHALVMMEFTVHPFDILNSLTPLHGYRVARDISKIGYESHLFVPFLSSQAKKQINLGIYQIFYFCGHGTGIEDNNDYRSQYVLVANWGTPIFLVSGLVDYLIARYVLHVSLQWLKYDEIITTSDYALVFINACYSSSHSYWADAFNLQQRNFNTSQAFIGPDGPVAIKSSVNFGDIFWKAIGEGKTVKEASEAARYGLIWPAEKDMYFPPYGKLDSIVWWDPGEGSYWEFTP